MKSTFFIIFVSVLTFAFPSSLYSQIEPTDLDYATLKQEFNLAKDNPILISILGVNCPPCRTHRDDVKNQIMNQCDNPDLRWFIIWFEDPGHPALRSDAVSQASLTTDSRVTQWWYKEHQSSTPKNDSICYEFGFSSWMNCPYPWDITMLFDGGIEWLGVDPPNSTYCMSKTGCCNSFNISNLVAQVDTIDACDSSITIDSSNTAIFNIQNTSMNVEIFPNPAENEIFVQFSKDFQPKDITIHNIEGQVIYRQRNFEKDISNINVDLTGWEDGLYFILLISEKETISRRLIIAK